jgi:hypothetical protein
MTISEIVTKEFTCNQCGYKWTNRFNGRDQPVPKRCSKCKSYNWNQEGENITAEEKSLRARIRGMKNRYLNASTTWMNASIKNYWNNELVEKFLNLNPRPTVEQLRLILHGSRIGFNSRNPYKAQGFVPDPQNPSRMKYDKDEYLRILESEAKKRNEIMLKIVQERTGTIKVSSLIRY